MQVLRALDRADPAAVDPDRDTLGPLLDGGGGGALGSFSLASVVADVVLRSARRTPICMVFDDLHAADRSTLELLALVEPQWRAAPILVVATLRTVDARTAPTEERLIARLRQSADERTLAGLEPAEVGEWIERRTGERPTEACLATVTARAGGVPLFVEGLLGSGDLAAAGVPRSLRAVLLERMSRLPPDARKVLDGAALLRHGLELSLLTALTGVSAARARRALREAEDQGLVHRADDRWFWTHQLYAEVLADALDPERADALHGALFDLLADQPERLVARAEHGLAIGHPDAAGLLVEAAERALSVYGFATAADLFARAAERLSDPIARIEARAASGRALRQAGDGHGARDVLETAYRQAHARAADGTRPGLAALGGVALGLSELGEFGLTDSRAEQVLREALAGLEPAAHDTRAALLARLVVAVSNRDPLSPDLEPLLQAARTAASASTSARVRVQARVASLRVWRTDRLAERLEDVAALRSLLPELEHPADRQEVFRWSFNTALETCDGAAARQAVREMRDLARISNSPRVAFVALLRQATLDQLAGRFSDVDGAAIEAAGRRAGEPHAAFFRHACTALGALARGDEAAMREAAPIVAEVTSKAWSHYAGVPFQGHWLQVRAGLEPDHDLYGSWRAKRFRVTRWWGAVQALAFCAEIAMTRGDREGAQWVLEAIADYPDRYAGCGPTLPLGPLAAHEARLLAWLGRADEARDARTRALVLCDRLGASWCAQQLRELEVGSVPTERRGVEVEMVETAEGWLFRRGEDELRLRSARGWSHLATLVERPRASVHVLELTSGDRRQEVDTDGAPVLDSAAREAYTERLQSVYADLAEAEAHCDLGRVERLTAELDALTEELVAATGLGGRDRKQSNNAERARTAVKQAIRRATKSLAAHRPELAVHLDRSVRTGLVCVYEPEPGGLLLRVRRRP